MARLRGRTVSLTATASLLVLTVAQGAESVVRRSTLLVSDIEQSIHFYQQIGFRVWLDRGGERDPESSGGLPLNGKPAYSRIAIMAGQNDAIGMVGLLEYGNPPLEATREATGTIGVTDVVLVIQTDDIQEVHANLVSMGARILSPPRDYTVRSVAGQKYGAIMFFADPDGHVIEMSQVYRVEPLTD